MIQIKPVSQDVRTSLLKISLIFMVISVVLAALGVTIGRLGDRSDFKDLERLYKKERANAVQLQKDNAKLQKELAALSFEIHQYRKDYGNPEVIAKRRQEDIRRALEFMTRSSSPVRGSEPTGTTETTGTNE